ncbi:MAG: S8/S53 family peptidase, partial [Bacteroidota bacterium]
VFYSGQVADAVVYAHNKGKLIFNAAGTSLTWTSWWGVIFPANMSQTVAVTGVRTGSSLQRCNTCHDGSQVDFVVTMQDAGNTNRTALTLHTSGNQPSYTSGSSAATATMAGIAALVWGKNLGQNRNQVLQRLKDASQFYPSRSNSFGWGRVDALQAVNAVP